LLAYLFWHRPRPGVDAAEYEEAQRSFHARLEVESVCFRVESLPFDDGPGYEDWYLSEDWTALGELNATAVDSVHHPSHDEAAVLVSAGWGAVYAHVRGPGEIPAEASWRHKPPGQSLDNVLADIAGGIPVWQRQLVLGPAPELCVGSGGPRRQSVAP